MGQIDEVPEDDINEYMKVIRIEIFCRRRVPKQKVENLKDEELKRGLRFSVQKKNKIASKSLISHSMSRYSLNYPVCYTCAAVAMLDR